jgi:hypothetical protein
MYLAEWRKLRAHGLGHPVILVIKPPHVRVQQTGVRQQRITGAGHMIHAQM